MVASAPTPIKTQRVSVAELLITQAADANVRRGDLIPVGQVIRTNNARVQNGRLLLGGSVEATLWEWGVRNITLSKNSTLSIKSYAFCFGGGRILELNVKGEAYVRTRQLTQACSAVRVCLGLGRGCTTLRSAAKFRELTANNYVVGVTEGQVLGEDADKRFVPVPILAGQYSFMNADGQFSAPKTVGQSRGYHLVTKTKAVQSIQAEPGYRFEIRERKSKTLQLPVGLPFKVLSPLE